MLKVREITCHKIVNSRGEWSIATKVTLSDGSTGIQTIPDGASKGENEAVYIPVHKSLEIVSTLINDALKGEDPTQQEALDGVMISMDGTSTKKHLGANSILSVSLALAKAVAKSYDVELYQYLSYLHRGKWLKRKDVKFPTPVFNVINGGKHARNNLSFQEFMVIPSPRKSFDKQMEIGVKTYQTLKNQLTAKKYGTGVGDEGGFAPSGFTVEKALDFIQKAIAENYKVGTDAYIGMDVAAESFYDGEFYRIREQDIKLNREELLRFYKHLARKYPLIYIEDPYYENDVQGWKNFYQHFNDKLMVVADDLVVTNPKYLKLAVERKLANSVIVKPNQVGTLTETLAFIKMAQKNSMSICVSHRSGDTAEDTFIADLALGVGAEFIKSGSPVRGERVAKYNRLLEVFFD